MRKLKLPLLAALLALGSCLKEPDLSQLSSDFIVITNYDKNAVFTSYQTFVMPPYVGAITDNPKDSVLPESSGDTILAQVSKNLTARGYTQVTRDKSPNLGVVVTALKNTTIVTGWYPGGWWGYPGWGGCYWGYCGGYPWYPAYYPTYVYQTGSVIVELVDLKNVKAGENKLNVIWTNWNGGALGSQSSNLANALKSIDQAFVQSPYISAK